MSTSTSKMQKLSFQWDIRDFDYCDLVKDESFNSPKFSIPDSTFKSEWKLRMYPAGTRELEVRDNLTLLLLRLDSGETLNVKHSISLLNRNGTRMYTENCSALCQRSGYTNPIENQMISANIIEIKANVRTFLDDCVLSVLCEMEIYEETDEIQNAEAEKHTQLYATSSVIKSMNKPSRFDAENSQRTTAYLPYGKLCLCFQGITKLVNTISYLYFEIIDTEHLEITEVPITIILKEKSHKCTIKRSLNKMLYVGTTEISVALSTRCMLESPLDATAINLTSIIRKVRGDYRKMFNKSEFGDLSIVVGEKTLRVHKDILSSRCPVFAAMFSNEWKEKTAQSISIPEFDYKTIMALIEYIYCGGGDEEDSVENAADPLEVLKVAHMYQLDDLKGKCELRLCKNLEKSTVSRFIVLAETYDLPTLRCAAFLYMTNNKI